MFERDVRATESTGLKKGFKQSGIRERIRFISPHPKDFTDDAIDAIANCEKVCKSVHLPLQSGSSNVLKVMNRKYTKEQYLSLAYKIKEDITGLYFFNPFNVDILKDVISNLEKSKNLNNRNAKLFFYYPSKEYL